tara:strand:- start:64 stop:939 length:876 start_codon:yes stop_codon:yes gene_type:complete
VSKLGLGTVQFGTDYGLNSLDGQVIPKEVKKILNYARSKQIVLLDTAPAYGNSEEILGGINNSEFQVVTKTRHFDTLKITNDEISLLNQDFNNSLKKLNQIKIYGLLIHNADDLLKPGGEKILDLLQQFKQTNKLMKVGVSVYDHIKLHSILDNFDIDMVQLPFNIIDRRMLDSGMLTSLYKKGIEVHARSVFLQGLLLMSAKLMPSKFNRWNNLWKLWHEWLHDNRISPVEASVRYAISFSEISKVLVGVDSVNQLKEIYKASSGTLPKIPDELQTTDADLLNPSNWEQL